MTTQAKHLHNSLQKLTTIKKIFKVLVTYITLQKIDIKPLQLRQAYNEDSLEGMGRSHQKRRAPVSNQT